MEVGGKGMISQYEACRRGLDYWLQSLGFSVGSKTQQEWCHGVLPRLSELSSGVPLLTAIPFFLWLTAIQKLR